MSSLILVTDMQEGILDTSEMAEEIQSAVNRLVENIKHLVEWALRTNHPVAFIAHTARKSEWERTDGDIFHHEQDFGRIIPKLLENLPNPVILKKRAKSLLSEEDVNQIYRGQAIDHFRSLDRWSPLDSVFVTGVNAGDCVLETAQDIRDGGFAKNVQILPGYTLRIANSQFADQFMSDNDLLKSLDGKLTGQGLWYKEEILKLMPQCEQFGIHLVESLKNPRNLETLDTPVLEKSGA